MDDIDKSKAFLFIEARSQRAEDAFSLQKNATIVAPAATASESALLLTLNNLPKHPEAGYVFGSSENSCDVLLDTASNRGVGSRSFSIYFHHESHDIFLRCLAYHGIFYREDTENLELKKLSQGSPLRIPPEKTWIIVVGSVQIALSAVVRDQSKQQEFNQNLEDIIGRLGDGDPNVEGLGLDPPGTSTMETPDTRVLKGIWGNYTAAGGKVGEGSYAWVTGCVSDTGITCCIKETKADVSRRAKLAFKQEIKILRRLVHPCIVQYIDRDPNGTWLAMDYLSLGDLAKQLQVRDFTPWETRAVTYQVLHALDHIHSNDIIHQDLKPGNILVRVRSEDQIWVKVADFGVSTWIPIAKVTKRGTPKYLAPECFGGPADDWTPKLDIWALAVVALTLLGHCPAAPEDTTTESDLYGSRSPYANGWDGALENRFEECRHESGQGTDPFFTTLSCMFVSNPEFRISASEACKNLHEEYRQGRFLLSGDRTPDFHNPVPVEDSRSDDASIFRFRELEARGLSLMMLQACYLVSLTSIMEAKCGELGADQEEATYGVMKKYFGQPDCTFWHFRRTNAWPEVYIKIELAIKLCQEDGILEDYVAILRQQKAQRDDPSNEGPGKPQLSLLKSSFISSHIIAITQEGRMLLVRHTDGFLYGPSVQAVWDKCLLPMKALENKPTYQPVDGAMLIPGVMSHNDFWWLSAATYTSF